MTNIPSIELYEGKVSRLRVIDNSIGSSNTEKCLKVTTDDELKLVRHVILKGLWSYSVVNVNDIVHVLDGNYDSDTATFSITNDSGILVVNPDLLIPSTTLMSANFCMRKAWLAERFKGWSSANRAMLVGIVVHELFQEACRTKIKDISLLKECALRLIDGNSILNNCYAIEITKDELMIEVESYIPHIASWIDIFMLNKNISNAANRNNGLDMTVVKVRDIEDNLWNTHLGLKGKVDVTLEVIMNDKKPVVKQILPLELKTGRASFSNEHEGQVALYSIMMEEFYNINEGLLLYLKDGHKMRKVNVKHSIKRDLMQLRNKLSSYLKNVDAGPHPKNIVNVCSRCEHLLDCCLTLQTLETEMLRESDVMAHDLVPPTLSHLTSAHLDFFKKWVSLMNLEVSYIKERNSESGFWNESSEDRESRGLAFSKMILKSQSHEMTSRCCVFVRAPKYKDSCGPLVRPDMIMKVHERVAVSIDSTFITKNSLQIAITLGVVLRIDDENGEIELMIENCIDLPLSTLFRIDIVANNGLFSANFTNLLRLMDASEQSEKLRTIIIDHKPVVYQNKFNKKIVTKGKDILKPLSLPFQKIILKALSTDSYLLLKASKDEHKTKMIVALVRLLVELDQTVLITSYSYSIVDSILLALKAHDIDFLRLGSVNRTHPELVDYLISKRTAHIKSVDELDKFYSSHCQVLGTTCLGTNHPIFERRLFDYCIIDEATQIVLPTCLSPLFSAKKFILIGDPNQTTKMVQSESARLMGLNQSLFALLHDNLNTFDISMSGDLPQKS